MRNDLYIDFGLSVERAIPELCNYLHLASFLGLARVFYTNLHWEKSMGGSRLFPHLKTYRSLVPRLYPRTQTNCNVKRDGVWQVWPSARYRLADGVWQTESSRRRLPDGRLEDATSAAASGRRRLPNGCLARWLFARRRLADAVWQRAVWQTASGRHGVCCLPDDIWQTLSGRGPSGRRHPADGIWQTRRLPSARRHLTDVASGRCRLPDAVWQRAVWQTPSGRRGVCQTALC